MTLTRSELRRALKYHTGGKLTSPADQDYYINRAELEVFGDWRQFDSELFQSAAQEVTTDADGIALMPASFSRMMFLYDSDEKEIGYIGHPRHTPRGTGFMFQGFDQTTNQRKVLILKGGNPEASVTYSFYDIEALLMGALDSAQSAVPNEHRHCIALKAAHLYFRDQGPPFQVTADTWHQNYLLEISKARTWYRTIHQSLEVVESASTDAGEAMTRHQGYIS
jgi:hypothetical protein